MFDELKTDASSLQEQVKVYAKTYGDLLKLKATKGASAAVSGLVVAIVSLLLFIFVIVFAGIGLGWWLGHLLNSMPLGFLCVAGFFLLVFIVIAAMKRKVIAPAIRNAIISKVYE